MAGYGDESFGRRTARVLSAVLIGRIASIAITGITIVLIARLLGPANYGIYIFAFGFASLIDAVGGLGIGTYLGRTLAIHGFKKDHRGMMRSLSSGYFLLLSFALLLTLLALGLSGYLSGTLYAGLGIPVITLMTASLMIFFIMVRSVSIHALIGLSKGFYSSLCSVAGNTIQLVLGVLLIIYGFGVEGALVGMLAGYAVSAALGTFLIFYSLREYGRTDLSMPRLRDLRETARFSFPIGANTMLNDGMQNFSVLFLGFYVSKAVLGDYGAALKGFATIILLYGSINSVLIPAFSRARLIKRKSELRRTYDKVLGYSLVAILPVFVYVMVFSQPAVYLFLSRSYSSAPGYLSLIVLGAAINAISLFIGSIIISGSRTIKMLKYNAVAVLVQLALLLALAPTFLVYGSIVAIFIVGNVVSLALFLRGARKLFGVRFDSGRILRIFASNILLGMVLVAVLYTVAYAAGGSASNLALLAELLAGLAAAALVYPALFMLTRAVKREDLESIRSSVERLPVLRVPVYWIVGYSSLFLGRNIEGK